MKKFKYQLEDLKEKEIKVKFHSVKEIINSIEITEHFYPIPCSRIYYSLRKLKRGFLFGRDFSTNPPTWKYKISKIEN